MKSIAIFGANGRLGREVVKAFTRENWNVRAITRDGKFKHHAELDGEVEVMAADALKRDEVLKAADGCEFIFNGLNPDYTKWTSLALPMTKNVLEAAHANQSTHLFIGNVYNYGKIMPEVLTEHTSQNPDTRKGRVRVEMERCMADYAEKRNVKTILVRAGDFFGGTGTGSGFDAVVVRELAKNVLRYPGPLDQVHAWAYIPDLAKTFVKLAEEKDKCEVFDTFHFAGYALKGDELIDVISEVVNQKLHVKAMPWKLVRFIGIAFPLMREVAEMSYLWKVPHRLDDTKLRTLLKPISTPIHEAMREALSDLQFM